MVDRVEIALCDYQEATLVAMANDLSRQIDNLALDQGSVATQTHEEMKQTFNIVCSYLWKIHNTVLSDTVRSPTY